VTSFSGGGSRSTRREPPTMNKQLVCFITCDCESSAPFLAHLVKGHVSVCHHLASVVRRKFSHLNLLLRSHWANCNQTLVEWSLNGPLPKLCPMIPTSNQYGRQAKNRKKGMQFSEHKLLVASYRPKRSDVVNSCTRY
jgi:hypothetical protein